jgi:PPP family 3-phenylpropionic acid transporter
MKLSEANTLRALYFLVFSCTASWLSFFAGYCDVKGLSPMQTSTILSVTPAMMFIVQPFYGMLADRAGYKKTLLFSSLLASISYVFFLFDGGFVYIFIITAFMALFYNTLQPVLDSLSLALVKRDPSFSYGTLRIAGAAGWSVTSITTGLLIDQIDTTIIFAVSAVCMVLTFLFAFTLHSEKSVQRISNEHTAEKISLKRSKALFFLLSCVFLVSVVGISIWNFYAVYMEERGSSYTWTGYGLSFQGICELPFFYFSAMIIGKLGVRNTLLITVIATALRLFLYAVVDHPHAVIAIEILHGLSWSLFWVVCVEYVNRLVREDWRATGQSILYAAYFGLGAIIGNYWTAFWRDENLKIAEIFMINAGITVCVALFIWLGMKKDQPGHIKIR